MKRLTGISASRGICIGPVFPFIRQELKVESYCVENIKEEIVRLDVAISKAKDQISLIYQKALGEASKADAEIFQAHRMILEDPELLKEVKNKIEKETICAEFAMMTTAQSFADMMSAMQDEYFKARATDIMDVGNRVLRILLGVAETAEDHYKADRLVRHTEFYPSGKMKMDQKFYEDAVK